MSRILSPCVGVCSTTVGDNVCRGCQRHDQEILDWFGYDSEQRTQRMRELDALRSDVAGRWLYVHDEAALAEQLTRHRIRFREDQSALSRAVELLRVGRTRIRDLSAYGITPCSGGEELEPEQLFSRINDEIMVEASKRANNEVSPAGHPPDATQDDAGKRKD